ncbi:hypothetical protein OCH239_17710 [Roseivivax halodurans JCM 10272]|uniref:Uncharacterized protein n=1 Tax=Roseivivax halodurans JCM 10272 TaxID=1449350 RepID=X7EGQ0_9RHOB|nr:hypothetical protein [Roseivivax halodurans]ETX15274.1 hypothetical protein OCH239_17710 [Roseivivax halodurans JCM 10272]
MPDDTLSPLRRFGLGAIVTMPAQISAATTPSAHEGGIPVLRTLVPGAGFLATLRLYLQAP